MTTCACELHVWAWSHVMTMVARSSSLLVAGWVAVPLVRLALRRETSVPSQVEEPDFLSSNLPSLVLEIWLKLEAEPDCQMAVGTSLTYCFVLGGTIPFPSTFSLSPRKAATTSRVTQTLTWWHIPVTSPFTFRPVEVRLGKRLLYELEYLS